jgi:hypothetical protein
VRTEYRVVIRGREKTPTLASLVRQALAISPIRQEIYLDGYIPCHPAFAIALSAQNAVLDTSSVSVHIETDPAFCRLPAGSVMNGSSTARAAFPPHSSRGNWSELKLYAVGNQAHHRGYGPPEEIVCIGTSSIHSS